MNVTDYAAKVKRQQETDAAELSHLLGLYVTVDRHGVARVNASLLLEALRSLHATV